MIHRFSVTKLNEWKIVWLKNCIRKQEFSVDNCRYALQGKYIYKHSREISNVRPNSYRSLCENMYKIIIIFNLSFLFLTQTKNNIKISVCLFCIKKENGSFISFIPINCSIILSFLWIRRSIKQKIWIKFNPNIIFSNINNIFIYLFFIKCTIFSSSCIHPKSSPVRLYTFFIIWKF